MTCHAILNVFIPVSIVLHVLCLRHICFDWSILGFLCIFYCISIGCVYERTSELTSNIRRKYLKYIAKRNDDNGGAVAIFVLNSVTMVARKATLPLNSMSFAREPYL